MTPQQVDSSRGDHVVFPREDRAMPRTESMPTTESVLRVTFSDEITSKPSWYSLVYQATAILQTEIVRGGGIAPVVLANWSIDETGQRGRPTFVLRLSDVPDDPQGVVARFSEESLRTDHDKLHKDLNHMWGDFLRYRSRRQAHDINLYISGSISGLQGDK